MFGAHVDLAANGGAALALGGTEVEPLTLDLAERDLEQVHRLDLSRCSFTIAITPST